jgi:glycosyltransferase involved in cell wall biosynthesis
VNSTAWHLITSEYPPQLGGVSDYTRLVATGLAEAGDEVHVWCPPAANGQAGLEKDEMESTAGVVVHRELGRFTISDLRRAGTLLDQLDSPRRLLVQWVPHGYGFQSMNLPFCFWLWQRARRRDVVEVMVHEPFLPFGEGSWKQSGVAAVHRLMTMVLLNAARRVWISIPAWEARLRPYALGRKLTFSWLPVASSIAVVDDPAGVKTIRGQYAAGGQQIVGHFGTYDRNITALLLLSLPSVLESTDGVVLLLGRGSTAMRAELIRRYPERADRIHATGSLSPTDLSRHIQACDLMLQPFIDGVSTRRTSVMVSLSHGMPIVTTSGRLTESLWAESGAVALTPIEDIEAIGMKTRQLLDDEISKNTLRKQAAALYRERFDIKHTISTLRVAR